MWDPTPVSSSEMGYKNGWMLPKSAPLLAAPTPMPDAVLRLSRPPDGESYPGSDQEEGNPGCSVCVFQ